MDNIKNSLLTLLIITFGVLYLYDRPLAESLIRVLSPFVMIFIGIGIVYFGVTIIRDNKRLAEDRMERFGKSSFQHVLSLQYRENPLRLTIALAGIVIIGIGFMALALSSGPNAFDGFRGIVVISAIITAVGSGIIAIIVALFMLSGDDLQQCSGRRLPIVMCDQS